MDGVGTALLISVSFSFRCKKKKKVVGGRQRHIFNNGVNFQAGSFLYVATVLQPVSHDRDRQSSEGVGTKMRILLIVLGIFTPFALGTLLDHGHGRDHGTIAVQP